MKIFNAHLIKQISVLVEGRGITYSTLFFAIFVIWLLGFLVGVFASTTVLTDNRALQKYVSAMSFIANPKGLIATKSTFPEVSAMYHAVVCWGLPFWFLVWLKWMNSQVGVSKTGVLFKTNLSWWNRLLLLLLVPFWLIMIYVVFNFNHGGDTRMIEFGTSRLQLALFGMGFQLCIAGMLAIVFFSLNRSIALE